MMGDQRAGKQNFDNQILWITPANLQVDGHEIKQIPNENFMGFTYVFQLGSIPIRDWTEYFQTLGYIADDQTNEIQWRYSYRLSKGERFILNREKHKLKKVDYQNQTIIVKRRVIPDKEVSFNSVHYLKYIELSHNSIYSIFNYFIV